MDNRIPCPYCAEDIRPEAVRCPHCRSRLGGLDPTSWHRDQPDRREGDAEPVGDGGRDAGQAAVGMVAMPAGGI